MTLDEDLLRTVDKVVRKLGTTRSSFTREALRTAVKKSRVQELEQKQREGYRRKPIKTHEFSNWENEQVWVEP